MRVFVSLIIVAAGLMAPALAQDTNTEIELTRAVIQTERQSIVAAAMDLSKGEAEAFWPLYREYRGQVAVLGDRRVKLITDYADNLEVMTDLKARQMLDDYLGIEKGYVQLKTKYVKKFRKILPDKKVTRYFQIENKLDAVIDNELAAEIPLVE